MQRWSGQFEVSSGDPLPTVLVILGFILILVGVPLWFIEKGLSAWLLIFGVILIGIGIFLWIAERQSY